jgi:hypothetical protein
LKELDALNVNHLMQERGLGSWPQGRGVIVGVERERGLRSMKVRLMAITRMAPSHASERQDLISPLRQCW